MRLSSSRLSSVALAKEDGPLRQITKGTKCPDCKGRGFSDGLQPDSYWTCPTCAGTGDAPRVTALPLTPRKEALC